jgi:hypothetical protein
MGSADPRDLAEEMVDPGHRLPGERESESSPLLDDATHWLQVYQELLAFKRTLLRTAEIHKDGAPDAVAHEVSNDEELLRSELTRLEGRHRFWEEQVRTLQAD